jgi:hypothetical protein
MNHSDLIQIGKKWLIKARNCQVVLSETRAQSGEVPDIIRGVL